MGKQKKIYKKCNGDVEGPVFVLDHLRHIPAPPPSERSYKQERKNKPHQPFMRNPVKFMTPQSVSLT